MEHYAAIDVSLEWSSVCVVDAAGQIVREARVRSEREALVVFFEQSGLRFARIGLEAGPLSQWLDAGLVEAGLPALLIETRHVKAALKAMTVKTDRNDARGMAQLMRMAWFRAVHVKAPMPCAGESQRHGRHGVPPGVSDAAMSIPTRRRGPTVPKALLKSPALRQIQGLSPFVTHIDRAVCELAHTQSRICRFVSIRPASPQVDSVGVPPFGGETWKRRAAARA